MTPLVLLVDDQEWTSRSIESILRPRGHVVLKAYTGRQSLELVQKVSHGPAELFNVRGRGFLREGYRADLALVDMHSPQRVERGDVLYKCGWSPLEGDTLRSRVTTTLVNGELKYRNGEFFGTAGGMRLEFDRQ